MDNIIKYILMFFFYSFAGWCLESTYCSIGEKRLVNRGFLTGPLCPIYGTASLVLIVLIYNPFKDNPLAVFALGIILCDIVEYLTSYLMEKLFAARWWDYTYELLNIKGRICLKHSLYWGVISIIFVNVIHPATENLYAKITGNYVYYILAAVLIVFVIDVIHAVIKASDIRKLHQKLNNLIDVLGSELTSFKDTVTEKYESIQAALEKQGDKFNEIKLQIEDVVIDFDRHITRKDREKDTEKKTKNRFIYNNPFLEKVTKNKYKKLIDLIDSFKADFFEDGDKQ